MLFKVKFFFILLYIAEVFEGMAIDEKPCGSTTVNGVWHLISSNPWICYALVIVGCCQSSGGVLLEFRLDFLCRAGINYGTLSCCDKGCSDAAEKIPQKSVTSGAKVSPYKK
jgi:hypothetical protein